MSKDRVTFNTVAWDAGLDRLRTEGLVSLARRMGVSGGQILRDEAKARASVSHATTQFRYNVNSRGSHGEGALAASIYLAFNEKLSSQTQHAYSVSWNNKQTFWGKFREFGHWIEFAFYYDESGVYHSIKSKPLKSKVWVAAHPFLGPTFDASLAAVRSAMIERGKIELPKLLRGEIQ